MMKRLRGRNLAHPGCLIGVIVGLSVGIILAGVLAISFNVAFNIDAWIWLGLTVVLGAIGWIVGAALTTRYAAADQETHTTNSSEADA
jgi:hypothetical protein